MADVQKTIEIIFGAQDSTGAGFNSIEGGFSSLDAKARDLASPFADLTSSILAIDTALITLAGTMTAISVSLASDFQDAVLTISSLFDATTEESGIFGEALLEFSRTSVFAMEDIQEAAYIAISTGTDWKEATEFLAGAQQLAVVGSADLTEATSVLTRTMNAYGAEAQEVDRYSEALWVTAQTGDTNLSKLSTAMGLVASNAANAGIPIETLGAAIAAMTSGGIITNTTMTNLKALIIELLNPSDDLATAMGGLRVETDGLQAVMQQLQEYTGGTAQAYTSLFGSQEAATAAMVLGNDKTGTFNTTLGIMNDSIYSLQGNYDLLAEKSSLAMQSMQNSFKATMVDFGLPLLDEYGDAITALGSIFDTIDISFKEGVFDDVYGVLEGFLGNLSEQLTNIAGNLGEALELVDFSGLAASLTSLGEAMEGVFIDIFGEIDTTKPEDVAEAIQVAVNLLTQLVTVTEGIIEYFTPIFQAIGEAAQRISETNTESTEATGNFLAAMTALSNFGTVAAGVLVAINESGASIKSVFDIIAGSVSLLVNAVQVAFGTLMLIVTDLASGLLGIAEAVTFGELDDDVKAVKANVEAFAESLKTNIKTNATEGFFALQTLGDGLIGVATSSAEAATDVDDVGTSLANISGEVNPAIAAFDELNASVQEGSRIITESGTVWGSIDGYMVNLSDAAEDAGVNIDLMVDPLADVATNAGDAATGVEELTDATEGTAGNLSSMNDELPGVATGMGDFQDAAGNAYTQTTGLNGELVIAATNLTGVKTASDETATSVDEAATASEDLYIALEKIASDERIKNMEARVELNIAQIEADTERALAAFDSINTGITSTGEVISEALGVLGGLESNTRVYNDILDIVRQEYELRVAQFEKQQELIDQQIDYMSERTKALSKGVVLDIKADGMEQEIEAFMYKIVEKIHAKAVGDEAEFLLSLP